MFSKFVKCFLPELHFLPVGIIHFRHDKGNDPEMVKPLNLCLKACLFYH